MADLADILTQLRALAQNALTAANITAAAYTEWPTAQMVQQAPSKPFVTVTHRHGVFQRKSMPFDHSETDNVVGLQSSLSDFSMAPGQTVVLTIAPPPSQPHVARPLVYLNPPPAAPAVNVGDTVSFELTNADFNGAATYVAVANDTTDTVAVALAQNITNEFPVLAVSESNSQISITNNDSVGYHVKTNYTNSTTVDECVEWSVDSIQVNMWSGNLDTRYALIKVLRAFLAQLDRANGFALPSGEWVELKLNGLTPLPNNTDKNVYSDFFLVTTEAMVDVQSERYGIVATKQQVAPE